MVRADRHTPLVVKYRRQLPLTHVPAGQQIAFEDHAHPHSGRLDAHVRPVEIKNEVFMPAADLVPRQPVAPVNQGAVGVDQIAGQQIFHSLHRMAG